MHGGDRIAQLLQAQGVAHIFTLVGGHISPILVACKQRGVRVVDTRHEATAVFAADAVARLSGRPGVAVVTAGPGLTNTVTAVKNAQIAQSPLVLLGGAAATALRGRGALQDIDQAALLGPHVKQIFQARRVRQLVPMVEEAFRVARDGVPGPVFVECPIDLLYPEAVVRRLYGVQEQGSTEGSPWSRRLVQAYLNRHVNRLFSRVPETPPQPPAPPWPLLPDPDQMDRAAQQLQQSARPVMLLGSQVVLDPSRLDAIVDAVTRLRVPVYLSGMARGLLGVDHPLQMRHGRRDALREADLVLLAGTPSDFRLDYGRAVGRHAFLVGVNRSREDLNLNRRPDLGLVADPGRFLCRLAQQVTSNPRWAEWGQRLRARDDARNREIAGQAGMATEWINPLYLCRELDAHLPPESILIGDGGDFVATASYLLRPRGPLSWLDPGPFGTLGVGAGFALGAKLCRPHAQVWVLFGDGAVGYSLPELDTFVRHRIPVIALVGNDASWAQIAREQVEILGDDVATVLAPSDYHRVAVALGATGIRADDPERLPDRLRQAQEAVTLGQPVLINALIGKTDFRRGSISV